MLRDYIMVDSYIRMNFFFSFVFLLCFSSIYSQSIKDLDDKFGFKDFRFGQSLESLKEDIELYYYSDNLYKYKKNKPSELFGWSWSNLSLGFHEAKLVYIQVNFRNDEKLFHSLVESLNRVFGRSIPLSSYALRKVGAKSAYQWNGEKVEMQIVFYELDGEFLTDENAVSLTIRVKDIDRIMEKGEF